MSDDIWKGALRLVPGLAKYIARRVKGGKMTIEEVVEEMERRIDENRDIIDKKIEGKFG